MRLKAQSIEVAVAEKPVLAMEVQAAAGIG